MRATWMTLVVLLLVGAATVTTAQIPRTISHQGLLMVAGGGAVPDGNYTLTFRIYNVEVGGTALWTETQTLAVSGGVYNATLGSVTGLNLAFDVQYWLGVQVTGEPEMTPRVRLTSAPYAYRAIVAESLSGGTAGDITAVYADAGLTGGAESGDAHLAVGAGTGLEVSADAVGLTAPYVSGSAYDGRFVNEGQANSVTVDMVQPSVVSSLDGVTNDGGNIDLVPGANITITPDDANNTITIAASGGGGIGGSGTIDYIPKFTGTTTIGNSMIYESAGSRIGIGTTAPTDPLTVGGTIASSSGGFKFPDATTQTTSFNGSTASGDLYGAYPSPAVGRLHGRWMSPADPDSGQVLRWDGVMWVPVPDGLELPFIASGAYPFRALEVTNTFTGGDAACIIGRHYPAGGGGTGVRGIGDYKGVQGDCWITDEGLYDYYGIWGRTAGAGQFNHGVYGYSVGGLFNYGVKGEAYGGDGLTYGLYGHATGSGAGDKYGVYGYASGTGTLYAGYFVGDVTVLGTLTKGGGAFKIDHPLDPENRYLLHSFVESPDMMNVYNGNVALDPNGEAVVELPEWFQALNREFRYQLTPLGGPGPGLYIAEEIEGNRFKIAGGTPGLKVSWQVTGIRQDPFANAHRIPVELDKGPKERGRYLHPDAFGLPEERGVGYQAPPVSRREGAPAR